MLNFIAAATIWYLTAYVPYAVYDADLMYLEGVKFSSGGECSIYGQEAARTDQFPPYSTAWACLTIEQIVIERARLKLEREGKLT